MRISTFVLSLVALGTGCAGGAPSGNPPPASSAPVAIASASPVAPPIASASSAATAAKKPEPCGELGCLLFDSPEEAFAEVLREQPRILAVGEAHAQKGTEGVASTTSRFTERFLPMLSPRATDLLLELWVADGKCGKKEATVAKEQKQVSEPQAETNQNEFVTLGNKSKSLGIQPHVLRPSCEEYDKILKAGPDGVDQMLTMIARMTATMAKNFLTLNAASPEKLLVAYGGAMHNDVAPRQGREQWSFGPELSTATGGKYVELDLIVPEFIKDTDAWKAFAWYPHFDRAAHPTKATLFHPQAHSYVLVFPSTK